MSGWAILQDQPVEKVLVEHRRRPMSVLAQPFSERGREKRKRPVNG